MDFRSMFLFLMLFLFQNGVLQGQNVSNDSPERIYIDLKQMGLGCINRVC